MGESHIKELAFILFIVPFSSTIPPFFLIFSFPLDFSNLTLRRSLYVKPSSASEWIKISLTKYYAQWTTNCTASHVIICAKSYYVNILAYISLNRMTQECRERAYIQIYWNDTLWSYPLIENCIFSLRRQKRTICLF